MADFLSTILDKASSNLKHIVLPEGKDQRMIDAAAVLSSKKITKLTMLGDESKIKSALEEKGADFSFITIINPETSELTEKYATQLYELRKHKGVDQEKATSFVKMLNYFGTMMVYNGDADGLVSGAVHSSADTIRPALQIVKCAPGCSTVSSTFFMCKGEQTLLFSDCALNTNPDESQLADIALSTANTAKQFGITPKVAMLTYSTLGSGKGPDVDRMAEATKLAKEKFKEHFKGDYALDGEIQFDASFVPAIAENKCPQSPLKGEANIFIFPSLESGNVGYKMVERLAGMAAYGPVLQGIAKPVNDLSRGCSADDIVATVAITAIQAQSM